MKVGKYSGTKVSEAKPLIRDEMYAEGLAMPYSEPEKQVRVCVCVCVSVRVSLCVCRYVSACGIEGCEPGMWTSVCVCVCVSFLFC